MDIELEPTASSRLAQFGKWFGIIGAILCGLLVLIILGTVIAGSNVRIGDTAGAMGIGMAYVVLIPMAAIPAGIVCLVGAILSGLAQRQQASRDARLGLILSLAAPGAVVVCYGVGFALL